MKARLKKPYQGIRELKGQDTAKLISEAAERGGPGGLRKTRTAPILRWSMHWNRDPEDDLPI